MGYSACCAALRDADLRPLVAGIHSPALVIAGELDEATSPAQPEELHAAIAGSALAVLHGATHLANIERPPTFSALLRRFLLS